jgi:HSP20 family molecular chaperone IbpA
MFGEEEFSLFLFILSKLPKEEPASRIRRLSGRILYELSVPGVNDMNNILINQLENSIEIKAIADNKVYSKTLNINLPILGYRLSQGNLTIELQQ